MAEDPFAKLQETADLYRRVFETVDGRAVLADLKQAFQVNESVFSFVMHDGSARQLDVNYTLVLAAKRECFDYIGNLCGLTYEDIVAMKFYAALEEERE